MAVVGGPRVVGSGFVVDFGGVVLVVRASRVVGLGVVKGS